jgi:rod shape-determining protein MreB
VKNALNVANLTALLDEIAAGFAAVGLLNEKRQTEELRARLGHDEPAKVVVIGEFNTGKSTLVNALCGTALLPVGIIPTTATINVVSHSERPQIMVVHWDGRETELPFDVDVLQRFTAKNGDQSDIREVRIQTPMAPKGLVLLDTPGVSDVNQTRAEIVYETIPQAHALVFVMDIQQVLKRSEVNFLRERVLGSSLVKTWYVLNHTDRVANAAEIDAAVKRVRDGVAAIYQEVASRFSDSGATAMAEIVSSHAQHIPVFPVSAKMKLRSIEGQAPGRYPSEFWNQVIRLGEPSERDAAVIDGVRAHAAALLLRLRQAVSDRIVMQSAARDRLREMAQRDAQILRKSIKACQSALAKLETTRTRLMSETEGSIDQIFEIAAASFEAKASQHGVERALELTQQEVGRKTESRIELLNQSVEQVAKDCCADAYAFLPLAHDKPTISVASPDSTGPVPQRDLVEELGVLLNDPINQVGLLVAAFLSTPVGLAVVAFRVIGRLFGGSQPQGLSNVPVTLRHTGTQLKHQLTAALSERFDTIGLTITVVLDEPQHRIRSACKALSGDDGESRLDEQWQKRVNSLIADCDALRQSSSAGELRKTAPAVGKLLGVRSIPTLPSGSQPYLTTAPIGATHAGTILDPSFSSETLGIDLGTTSTRVYARGKGIVVNEPSIVAINKNTGKVEAVGKEAKEMLGRTPGNVVAITPMKDGVIADVKTFEKMLNYFIQKADNGKMLVHPRIVIGVPSGITQLEKSAFMDSAYSANAGQVHLVEQAIVAAIGAGLPITEPISNLIVDIGAATTDIAVIALSGIVYSRSVRMAGNQMDEAIINYLKRKYNLLIGKCTAEQIKIKIGSAYPLDKPLTMEIKGRNLIGGERKTVTVDDSEFREALSECVTTIINAIRAALARIPPELNADISDHGIVLTGGGALLKNLDVRIREESGLPVLVSDDPLNVVSRGLGLLLQKPEMIHLFDISAPR